MDLAWNLESVSAAVRLLVRLCHPKIAEFCNLEAAAPECGKYLLMGRMIPAAQQVSSPVTNNKVKHGGLLVQTCFCHYAYSMLSIIAIAHKDNGNLRTSRKNLFIFIACITMHFLLHHYTNIQHQSKTLD